MLGAQLPAGNGRRVLVAEDSGVTQDLLKLLLTERGYAVDVVGDGEQALASLDNSDYDVVLMDFHLPKFDGLKVAASYRSSKRGRQPRFIAITSDMKGLLAHASNCETFDGVVPKPFDINEICKAIDGVAEAPFLDSAAAELPTTSPPTQSEVAAPKVGNDTRRLGRRDPSAIEKLGLQLLRWPDDLTHSLSVVDAAFDAVLVMERATPQDLAALWQRTGLHVLPVIDLAGSLGSRGDVDASRLGIGETDVIHRTVESFRDRRGRLDRNILLTEELGEKILARMLVSNRALTATYDPSQPSLVRYNTTLEDAALVREAELLFDSGFLRRDFLDRLHVCDRCESSRFNVREECPDCRSSKLSEEPYLHHFKCAFQGVESDFRHGDALICPKCRQELSHFSVDYDKPGTLVKCLSCGHAASEPQAGFICLDCGAHFLADVMRTRDVHSYALTERAIALLETGRSLLGHRQKALRFAELPLELIVALNASLKSHDETGTPFALLDISYANQRQIEADHGARQFDQSRELFLENLRSILRKEDKVVRGQLYDFALLNDVSPEEGRAEVGNLKEEASGTLRLDLGIVIDVFGPADFS